MLTASTPPPESERALVSTPIPSTSPSALDAAPGSSKGLTERSGMTFDAYPHREEHTDNSAFVRDAIIGFADGLTVPFALTAGLSSIGSSRLVIIGGLAELFAGAISMGLGAYLAALTDLRHYRVEEAREKREVEEMPEAEEEEIYEIFEPYGIARDICKGVVDSLIRDKEMWVKFMLHHELNLSEPPTSRLYLSALVMGLSYFLGGLVPMVPYFAFRDVTKALFTSIGITVVILIVFGYTKAMVTGAGRKGAILGAFETLAVGVLAAGSSYGIVRGVEKLAPRDGGGK